MKPMAPNRFNGFRNSIKKEQARKHRYKSRRNIALENEHPGKNERLTGEDDRLT